MSKPSLQAPWLSAFMDLGGRMRISSQRSSRKRFFPDSVIGNVHCSLRNQMVWHSVSMIAPRLRHTLLEIRNGVCDSTTAILIQYLSIGMRMARLHGTTLLLPKRNVMFTGLSKIIGRTESGTCSKNSSNWCWPITVWEAPKVHNTCCLWCGKQRDFRINVNRFRNSWFLHTWDSMVGHQESSIGCIRVLCFERGGCTVTLISPVPGGWCFLAIIHETLQFVFHLMVKLTVTCIGCLLLMWLCGMVCARVYVMLDCAGWYWIPLGLWVMLHDGGKHRLIFHDEDISLLSQVLLGDKDVGRLNLGPCIGWRIGRTCIGKPLGAFRLPMPGLQAQSARRLSYPLSERLAPLVAILRFALLSKALSVSRFRAS